MLKKACKNANCHFVDLPIEFSEYTFYKFLVVDFYEKMFKTETQLSLHDYKNAEKLSEQI